MSSVRVVQGTQLRHNVEITLIASRRDQMVISLHLLEIFVTHVQRWEIPSFASLRAHKDAIVVAAFKVSLALDCAIILTCRLIQSDADPHTNAGNLWNQSNI